MTVKETAKRQLQTTVNHAAQSLTCSIERPAGGWIATVRNALGMSGTQLGKRLNLSRGRISQMEKAEADGGVTLRSMKDTAEAMGCRFVYAIVPENGHIENVIEAQARKKAEALVGRANTHMALEKQALSENKNKKEIIRITEDLIRKQPSDFWVDE